MELKECMNALQGNKIKETFQMLYGSREDVLCMQRDRYLRAVDLFAQQFPARNDIQIFSASGRTEIGGNHTDHQRGIVLAGAVDLDTIAVVAFHDEGVVRVCSEGYAPVEIHLNALSANPEDDGTTALVRGVIAAFANNGVVVQGFDMFVTSAVIRGGGISSSAAFEVMLGTVINHHYHSGLSTPFDLAKAGWYAENAFLGKTCGLMDQTASAYGGLICIDFHNTEKPTIRQINLDFETYGYTLCVTDTKSSHEDLTDDYRAITEEMHQICDYFECDVLSQVEETQFYDKLPQLRNSCSDRAILRAMHFLLKQSELNRKRMRWITAILHNS